MGLRSYLRGWLFEDYLNEDGDGFMPDRISNYEGKPQFNQYATDAQKMVMVFGNPAVLKVFKLQCDLYSLGRFCVHKTMTTLNEKREKQNDPILALLANPNPYQTGKQLLWDQMFFNMLGVSYTYVDSAVVDTTNKMYVLMNNKIEWPQSLIKDADKLIFSTQKENELLKTVLTYRYDDNSTFKFPLSKLVINTDLSNGTGNFLAGNSTLDALYKVISNSDMALDSQNVNLDFSKKFLVAGKADPDNINKVPMGELEKESMEQKMLSRKSIHAIKQMIDIKRFVENYAQLELSKAYLDAYFLIGNMYNIPRDVLEAYNSSTFENQEKARASHVSYTLQPKGDDFCLALGQRLGYDKQNKQISISWDHLPFVQVFENDRAKANDLRAQTYLDLINNGVSIEEANALAGTDFTTGIPTQRNKVVQNGNA